MMMLNYFLIVGLSGRTRDHALVLSAEEDCDDNDRHYYCYYCYCRVSARSYQSLRRCSSYFKVLLYPPYCLWENFFKGSFVRFIRGSNPSKTGPKKKIVDPSTAREFFLFDPVLAHHQFWPSFDPVLTPPMLRC